MSEKTVVGLTEWVHIEHEEEKERVLARIDTGARLSSLDIRLAAELKLGPIERVKIVKSANGKVVRPVVHAQIRIKDKVYDATFTLADRSHMKYPVLVGQDVLSQGFMVDCAVQAEE